MKIIQIQYALWCIAMALLQLVEVVQSSIMEVKQWANNPFW